MDVEGRGCCLPNRENWELCLYLVGRLATCFSDNIPGYWVGGSDTERSGESLREQFHNCVCMRACVRTRMCVHVCMRAHVCVIRKAQVLWSMANQSHFIRTRSFTKRESV